MRRTRFLLVIAVALTAAACARQQQTYVIDPATGQAVPVMAQQSYPQQAYAQQLSSSPGGDRGLFSSQNSASQSFAQQGTQQPAPPPSGRGLFNSRSPAPQPQVYAPPPTQQPYVYQYNPPRQSAPQYAMPQYVSPQYATPQYAAPQTGGPYAAAPYGYASASPYQPAYTLDSGDKLRIVVFGQDGISNAYIVDAGGNVNLPLIGSVPARGYSTQQLTQAITERLSYVRPHVTVEIETYRPFSFWARSPIPANIPMSPT